MDVLMLLARSGPLSAKAVALYFRLPRTSIYRLLLTLERRGFVARDDVRGYAVGPVLRSLANGRGGTRDLRNVALPFMRRLAEVFRESVFLTVEQGGQAVVIEKVAPESPVRLQLEVGQRLPLHAGALGKILLAFGPTRISGSMRRMLPRLAPGTVTDARRLRPQLARIRAQGYAITLEEAVPGSWGVGVPLLSGSGSVLASLLLGGPLQRYDPARIPAMIAALQRAARSIVRVFDVGSAAPSPQKGTRQGTNRRFPADSQPTAHS
jgi:DNA-binding IclR family transcriptional regulator